MGLVLEKGLVLAEKYQLGHRIGEGGMGSVWQAKHLLLETDIAIKFMTATIGQSERSRKRFELEARASLVIKSPNVVQVLDYGIQDDTPYIVMELLEGEDLRAVLTRSKKLSMPEIFRILEQVVKALRRAHEVGLVHRDLKPGNIFLARSGNEQIIKLLDFGIAKDVDRKNDTSVTSSGSLLGSPLYMSPEQVRHTRQIDHRSDLWSLGVILYEALTGQTPFQSYCDNIGSLFVAICTDDWPLPSKIDPTLGPAVDEFFLRALSRPVAQRFQSATEMLERFGELCGVRPQLPSVAFDSGNWNEAKAAAKALNDEKVEVSEFTLPLEGDAAQSDTVPEEKQGRVSAPENRDGKQTRELSALEMADTADVATTTGDRAYSASSVPQLDGKTAKPSAKLRNAVAIGAFLAAGGVGVLALQGRAPEPPVSTNTISSKTIIQESAAPRPSSVKPVVQRARLIIDPVDVMVEVDGEKIEVRDGGVEIAAELGSTHVVHLIKGDTQSVSKVVMSSTGLVPEKLVLEAQKEVPKSAMSSSPTLVPVIKTTAKQKPVFDINE